MVDASYIYKKNSDPIAFLEAAATANKDQKFKARRKDDGIEIYARTFHTGFRGQAVKLWEFVSGKAHDRRILVREVIEDVIRQCRIQRGYDMSQAIQDRLLSNVIDKDITGADIQVLLKDILFSFAPLPDGPAGSEFALLGARLQEATILVIGTYKEKITKDELEGGTAKKYYKNFTSTISSWGSSAKNYLLENVCGPVGRLFSRTDDVEGEAVAVDPEKKEGKPSKEKKLANALAAAWSEVLDNDALGTKFTEFRTRLVNSSGSRFQFDLIESLVIKENFEDKGSMRRIFKNAFAQVKEKFVPDFEDDKGIIKRSGTLYVRDGQKSADGDCFYTYYRAQSNKSPTAPRIVVKSIQDPMASLEKIRRINANLLNEASYYVSDKDLYRGNVIGLPVFGGTVRMQSGGIGLVFKEPKDGPSAKDLVGLMRRMEGVELLGKSNSIDLRTLILKDLLSGASFIEGHPFTNAGISIRTFDLANVTIGTDNIARVSLNMTGYSPNEAQPAGSQYSTPTEVLRSAPPESQLGPKINDRFEENVYSGPIITEVSDDEEVSYADVIDPLLHSPGISEDSDRAVVSFDDVSQASATPSESLLMPWALLGSLFGPDAFASNPQIGELAAALAPGGRLYGQRLQEVLKHDAFKRIALREKELRDDLGKLIKESRTTEADKKLKKLEAKEDKKLKKLEAKEPAVQSSEQQLQVVKSKTKQGLASRIRRTFSGQVKISKDATN